MKVVSQTGVSLMHTNEDKGAAKATSLYGGDGQRPAGTSYIKTFTRGRKSR